MKVKLASTHFVVDKDGNAVAVTHTLNTTFGTGIVWKYSPAE